MTTSLTKFCISCQSPLRDGRTRYCPACPSASERDPFDPKEAARIEFQCLKQIAKSHLKDIEHARTHGMNAMAEIGYRRYCGVLRELLMEVRAYRGAS